MGGWLEGLKDAAGDLLGGIQGQVTFGTEQPTSGQVTFGEKRIMSVWALVAVAVVAFLVGRGAR